jgi:site-specific DNA-methyltransferase (adenine-specific)
VRDVMATLPDNCADLLVTSPPFLALRSYLPADHPDKHREIGSEPTPAAFLDTLYGLTADWGRLIPEWGSICVELGDTMSGSGGAGGDYNTDGLREGQAKFDGSMARTRAPSVSPNAGPGWPLAKSMCLMPHAYTIGLAYGHNPLTGQPHDAGQWRIRNVITWARPNPPVGSLGKRNPDKRTGDYKFRPACSFITVACRGTGRYFDLDAVRTEHNPNNHRPPVAPGQSERQHKAAANPLRNDVEHTYNNGNPAGAPPLDWHTDDLDGDWLWKLATAPYPGSHYATYPLALPRRLVLAMCPQSVCTVCGWPRERVTESVRTLDGEPVDPTVVDWSAQRNGSTAIGVDHNRVGRRSTTLGFTDCGHDNYRPGTVIDPFGGSGTTAVAAALEGRNATLIDLDRRNVDLVRRRLAENVRIISEVHDGDTVVWTVEQVTRTELVADAGGQMDLFAS